MNNQGQTLFLSLLLAAIIFVAGMLFLNFIKTDLTTARGTTQMDCSNLSISDGAKVTCLGLDATAPYFIILVFSVVGGIVLSRLLI